MAGNVAVQAGLGWQTPVLMSSIRKADVLASTVTGTDAAMAGMAAGPLEAAGAPVAAGLAAGLADATAEAEALAGTAGSESAAGVDAGVLLAGAVPAPQAAKAIINVLRTRSLVKRKHSCMR
jgi:hypothetical protein